MNESSNGIPRESESNLINNNPEGKAHIQIGAKQYAMTILGVVIGSVIGVLLYKWLLSYGLLAPIVPGAAVAICCSRIVKNRNLAISSICIVSTALCYIIMRGAMYDTANGNIIMNILNYIRFPQNWSTMDIVFTLANGIVGFFFCGPTVTKK